MLDRLLHHATTVVTDGDSYRMKQARTRTGGRHQNAEQPARSGDFYLATSGDLNLAIDRWRRCSGRRCVAGDGARRAGRLDGVDHLVPRQRAAAAS